MENLKLNTPLTIEEIDFRVQSVNKVGYATILAYKDARVDMNRLDAVYGVDGWQKKYDLINGNLFCSVGIFSDKSKEWIWKQDVGTESNTEKTKGEASDAFKRACFNLGIGRELYDYPIIKVELLDNEFDKATFKANYNFKLKDWTWISEFNNGKLTFLKAIDNNGKERFTYGIAPLKILTIGSKAWLKLTERVSSGETITKKQLLNFFDLKEVENELETLNIF